MNENKTSVVVRLKTGEVRVYRNARMDYPEGRILQVVSRQDGTVLENIQTSLISTAYNAAPMEVR